MAESGIGQTTEPLLVTRPTPLVSSSPSRTGSSPTALDSAGPLTALVPYWHYEYLFTMLELVAAWEHLLESGEALLGETLLEFREQDVVEVF